MNMKDNRNFKIAILLSINSVLTTCSLYLVYKLWIQHEVNFCQEQDYRGLYEKHKELEAEFKKLCIEAARTENKGTSESLDAPPV